MVALRVGLVIGVIGVGIGAGYALPLYSQHEDKSTAVIDEYDSIAALVSYNEMLGSFISIEPQTTNPRITITPRSNTKPFKFNPQSEIATTENDYITQSVLASLPNISMPANTKSIVVGNKIVFTSDYRPQGKHSSNIGRRTILQEVFNVGTKARIRSDKRLISAMSRVQGRTIRKSVASRVNPQTIRERTRFSKTFQSRNKSTRKKK